MKALCSKCGKRPAKFSRHGRVKADADHNMCLQCFRSIAESNQQTIELAEKETLARLQKDVREAAIRRHKEECRRLLYERDVALLWRNYDRKIQSVLDSHLGPSSLLAKRLAKICLDIGIKI